MVVWLVTVKTRAAVPPPVIVPVIAPVDAPLQVIVAVCETFEIDSEATVDIVIVFETNRCVSTVLTGNLEFNLRPTVGT